MVQNLQRNPTVTVNGVQVQKDESVLNQILDVAHVIGDILILLFSIVYYSCESIYRIFVPIPPKSVKGEICLITGGGHGIGKELALQYASEGATVVSWDINIENNDKTVSEIKKIGYPKAYAYRVDVTNREEVLRVATQIQKDVGDVTILINNAGIMPTRPFLEQTTDEIRRTMDINVMAHFWTLQAFLPSMKKNNHGHIVALSSLAGVVGLENLVPYCASKFAVRGMMESLHEEFRLSNPTNRVKFTAIYPYMVDTGLCKKPKIKFEKMMPLLKPSFVASEIMRAQRTDTPEMSIPTYMLSLNNQFRIWPRKTAFALQKFFSSGVEADK